METIGEINLNTTPAVVVRGEVNGLGVVRSLARAHVPTIVMDTTWRHSAMWSRSCKTVRVARLNGQSLIDSLVALQTKLGTRPVLILTDEMAVNTVSEHREELQRLYRFHLPSPPMVEVLANKALFQDFAERHGLPVPRTVVVTEEGDLAGISHLSFPVIMKPADKRPVHTGATERIAVAETLAEAKVRCRQLLQTAGQLVVQEMIDGPDDTIYFSLFHCGAEQRQVDMFIGRKVACHPPRVGSTAVCVAAPEVSDELNPLTASFIEATAYLGLGSLEFKWDPKRRRFVIIEPTVGRTDWQEEIATLSGVNLPLAAYRYELGLPLLKPAHVEGAVAWRESYRHRKGCSRLPANTRIYDGYWRINDPLPAVFFYVDAAFRKIFGRLARQKAF